MKLAKPLLLILLILSLVLFTDGSLYAQEPLMPLTLTSPASYYQGNSDFLENINMENYGKENFPTTKLSYGVINIGTSWVEIPQRVAEVSQEKNLLAGFTFGLGEGIAKGVTRAAAGGIDLATFMIPPYENPMMEPAYTANNPQRDGLKIEVLSW